MPSSYEPEPQGTNAGTAEVLAARVRFQWPVLPRFVTYLLVGALNTAFGYGAFAILLLVGLHYALAGALATILGILFNFQTTGRLVFGSKDPSLLLRFLGVYGFIYVLNMAVLRLLDAGARGRLEILAVQAALVLPVAGLSYLLHRRFVFAQEVASS